MDEFIENDLKQFDPQKDYAPLENNPDLKADYYIATKAKPLFLFGIRDDNRASKVIITCFQFQRNGIDFRSVIINEKFDELTKFNQL